MASSYPVRSPSYSIYCAYLKKLQLINSIFDHINRISQPILEMPRGSRKYDTLIQAVIKEHRLLNLVTLEMIGRFHPELKSIYHLFSLFAIGIGIDRSVDML